MDNPGTIFFSIFMAVWTVLFIEFWKREQSRLQFQWDIIDYEKNIESVRPEFEAKVSKFAAKRKNPITGVSLRLLNSSHKRKAIHSSRFTLEGKRAFRADEKAGGKVRPLSGRGPLHGKPAHVHKRP